MKEQYYYIKNLEGTLCSKDLELCKFSIKNRELVYFEDLSNGEFYPWELSQLGVSYGSFNDFFNRRVVKDGAMLIREYLNSLELNNYDFDEIIKRTNGSNHDTFWVKFKDIGAQSWNELNHTHFPIYK